MKEHYEFHVRLDPELGLRVEASAKSDRRSMTKQCETLIAEALAARMAKMTEIVLDQTYATRMAKPMPYQREAMEVLTDKRIKGVTVLKGRR